MNKMWYLKISVYREYWNFPRNFLFIISYQDTNESFKVRYCHWAKRLGKDKNWKQLVAFYEPGVKKISDKLLNYKSRRQMS